jgi:hypothetical protein
MLKKINFAPGINRESTQYSADGYWYNSNNIRFRGGYAESIGGWVRDGDSIAMGIARDLFVWTDYSGNSLSSIGTSWKQYVEVGGSLWDITQVRKTTTAISRDKIKTITDIGDGETSALEITDVGHGVVLNDFILYDNLSGASGDAAWSFGGINVYDELNGASGSGSEKQVIEIVSVDIYRVECSATVGSDVTGVNSATFDINYLANVGLSSQSEGRGWGVGIWGGADGGRGWGDAASISLVTGELRLVSVSNYNEDLMFSNSGGPIYYWDTSANMAEGIPRDGVAYRSKSLTDYAGSSDPPVICESFLVSERDGHVIAFGCNDIGSTDPNNLLVRWSDQDNPFDWTPTVINTSGGQMLRVGSKVMGAVSAKSEIVIFTDSALYSMRFIGPPDIFGFTLISEGVQLLTRRSVINVANVVYFMGEDNFYTYTGTVSPLHSPIEKLIFSDFNREQRDKIFVGLNATYSELFWFYCTADSIEPDKYVAYNYSENTWYMGNFDMSSLTLDTPSGPPDGSLNRTAWVDARLRNETLATYVFNWDPSATPPVEQSAVMAHEVGRGVSGGVMPCFVESGFFDISSGESMSFVSRAIPDIQFFDIASDTTNPVITLSLIGNDFPGSLNSTISSSDIIYDKSTGIYSSTESGDPLTVQPPGNDVAVRARGRSLSLKIASNGSHFGWRFGVTRLDLRPDGRR